MATVRNMLPWLASCCLMAVVMDSAVAAPIVGTWAYSVYGLCPQGCGPKVKTREVKCTDAAGATIVDSYCNASIKPASSSVCRMMDCGPFETSGPFSVCSGCFQTRTQVCEQLLGNGTRIQLPLANCNLTAASGRRVCAVHLCNATWEARSYNCCHARAALGRVCVDKLNRNEVVLDEACAEHVRIYNHPTPQPATCMPATCPTTVMATTTPMPTTAVPVTTATTPELSPTGQESTSADAPDQPGDGDDAELVAGGDNNLAGKESAAASLTFSYAALVASSLLTALLCST